MKQIIKFIFLIVIISTPKLNAQNISDKAFNWQMNENCWQFENNNSEVFVITETKAKLNNYSLKQIKKDLGAFIDDFGLGMQYTSTIKLKLYISSDAEFCVSKIGSMLGSKLLTQKQISTLVEYLESRWQFSPARQREIPVNYLGTVYIEVSAGKLKNISLPNLSTKS